MRPSDPCPISSAMRWSSAARFSSAVDISKVLSRSAFPSVAINLLYLGDHIRILNPAEAVEQFHDLAAQIMRAHSTNSSTNVSG